MWYELKTKKGRDNGLFVLRIFEKEDSAPIEVEYSSRYDIGRDSNHWKIIR